MKDGPRVPSSTYLDPVVENQIKRFARHEKKSVAWVKAKAILFYFGLREDLKPTTKERPRKRR